MKARLQYVPLRPPADAEAAFSERLNERDNIDMRQDDNVLQ